MSLSVATDERMSSAHHIQGLHMSEGDSIPANEQGLPSYVRPFLSSMYDENEPELLEGDEEVEQQQQLQQQQDEGEQEEEEEQEQQDEIWEGEEEDQAELEGPSQVGDFVEEKTEDLDMGNYEPEEWWVHAVYPEDERPVPLKEQLYGKLLDEGYNSWEARERLAAPEDGDNPGSTHRFQPSLALREKRKEHRAKEKRLTQLKWVAERLPEMNWDKPERAIKKAAKRVQKAEISVVVARVFMRVMEEAEGVLYG